MDSTLKPKPTDDPHDFVVVAPDAVRVAPADEELSTLLHKAAHYHSQTQNLAASGRAAGATVPPVDARFRPAAVDNALIPGKGRSMARRALRAFAALLLAACIGLAAVAWRSYGDKITKQIAKMATQLVMTSSLQSAEKPAPPEQPAVPAVEAEAANPAPPQPAAPAETAAQVVVPAAPAAAAPSADSAQLIQSMARDLASLGQEMEQLKAGIEELKASQQQISRDLTKASEAKASEQSQRSRVSAPPLRPAAARPRKPIPPYPPAQATVTPPLQQSAAPYIPRQPDYHAPRPIEPPPQMNAEPSSDSEMSSVPRPPMPVR
jgi:hypothetical protein